MSRAYSYLRFSTPEQMRGSSFRRQADMARQFALKRGLDLDEELTFQDLGVSAFRGGNVRRGELREFQRAIESGLVPEGSYLLVENLDRISREAAWYAVQTLGSIVDAGVRVVTLMDEREYSHETLTRDPMALMLAVLTFSRANEESETKARRGRVAWEAKRANAREKPLTARAPAWLRLEPSTGSFKAIRDRAAVVRKIFRWSLDGMGQNKIAETLNRQGVPTFGRAAGWHSSYVSKVLKNPAVVGTLVPHTLEYKEGRKKRKPLEPIPDYYPAVVDEETFSRVHSLLRSRTPRRGRHAAAEVQNLFGGLSKCPICGGTMTLTNKGRRARRRLVCVAAKAGGECVYHSVLYEQVEHAFLENADSVMAAVPAGDAGKQVDQALENADAALLGLGDEIERLLDAIQKGPIPALTQRLRELEDGKDALEAERRHLMEKQAETMGPLVEHKLDDLSASLKETPLDRTKANSLLRQLCEEVVVDYPNGMLSFLWKHGGETGLVFGWPTDESAADDA
jgi:DNA invertase Pin-like site-specific DNA recombinase